MNTLPCGQCKHYDPILSSGERHKGRGWCVMKSKYPHQEGPGQVFPAYAKRVGPGQLAEPYLVGQNQVVPPCPDAQASKHDVVHEKKKAQGATGKGTRILV